MIWMVLNGIHREDDRGFGLPAPKGLSFGAQASVPEGSASGVEGLIRCDCYIVN